MNGPKILLLFKVWNCAYELDLKNTESRINSISNLKFRFYFIILCLLSCRFSFWRFMLFFWFWILENIWNQSSVHQFRVSVEISNTHLSLLFMYLSFTANVLLHSESYQYFFDIYEDHFKWPSKLLALFNYLMENIWIWYCTLYLKNIFI